MILVMNFHVSQEFAETKVQHSDLDVEANLSCQEISTNELYVQVNYRRTFD